MSIASTDILCPSLLNVFAIENEHIKPSYPGYTITRWITLFGGEGTTLPHESVLIYCNNQGKVIINDTAPQAVKDAFKNIGLN